MTRLTTARLTLRPPTTRDLADLHRGVWGDARVTWDRTARTPEQSDDMLRGRIEHWQRHGFGPWVVTGRSTGEVLGIGGLQHLEDGEEVEVGYYLSTTSWGRGYGTEIAGEALRYGFEDLGLDRVLAVVRPENLASQKVLAKSGLRFDHEAEHYGAHVQVWSASRTPDARPARRDGTTPVPGPLG